MKYYAIKPDRIVTDWHVCESLVKGVKGAQYKSFKTEADARAWLNNDTEKNLDTTVPCIPYVNDKYRISGDIHVVDSRIDPLTVRTKASTRVSVDGSFKITSSVILTVYTVTNSNMHKPTMWLVRLLRLATR